MVEPLFLIESVATTPRPGDSVSLDGPEAKHAISVRRMRVGEAISLTDGRGLRIRGEVFDTQDRTLTVHVKSAEVEPAPEMRMTLVQALAKGDRDELAIQAATEAGIWSVVPWQASRSISRWDANKAKKGRERWQTIVAEAAKQSLRVFVPEVSEPASSADIAALIASSDLSLVLDPTSSLGLGAIETSSLKGSILLIVGPEGGISPDELAQFERAGAKRIHLGSSILRTSTAGLVALAALQARAGSYN